MRIGLGAEVRTHDGSAAGHVKHAIVDCDRNEITDYVVSTGRFLGHDVVIPSDQFDRASEDGEWVSVKMTKAEIGKLGRFETADFAPPSGDRLPPSDVGFPASAQLPESGPSRESRVPLSDERQPRISPLIGKGTKVIDRDGDEIGVLQDLRVGDHTHELCAMVVRPGGTLQRVLGDGQTQEIEADQIDRIDAEGVHIALDREDLAASR
ncbi:MAG: PRC-barrel domain-containing protein [Elusimicrobia bacterium]|nr:PRC-barrel domain-containing protein [Elusimicrobiota bacterium]